MTNSTKYLLSLMVTVVFLAWAGTMVAAKPQNPKTAEEFNNRGLDRQNSGDLDGAIADYTKALSKSVAFYYNRGIALQNQQQLDAAIKDFSEALKLSPDFHKANLNRAVALLEKGDLDGAIADYTRTLEFETNDVGFLRTSYGETKEKRFSRRPR